jgi:hypothetical protein
MPRYLGPQSEARGVKPLLHPIIGKGVHCQELNQYRDGKPDQAAERIVASCARFREPGCFLRATEPLREIIPSSAER